MNAAHPAGQSRASAADEETPPSGIPVARPLGRSRQRRQELLDAADRVIMRDGPEASMNAIAAEAGITKPILYRHFGDKAGLFQAVADRHTEELLGLIRNALVTRGGRRRRTEATLDTYLAFIESRPQVYRFLMHKASVEEPEVHGQMTSFVRRVAEELGAGIQFDLGLPDTQRTLALAWGHAIVGMVQQAGDWWLEERSIGREELVTWLADLLWGQLAQRDRRGES